MGIKRLIVTAMIILFCAGIGGCALPMLHQESERQDLTIRITVEDTQADTVAAKETLTDLSEKDLMYIFSEKSTQNVIADYYGDFDHDGIHEVFVVTGEVLDGPATDSKAIYGQLWLVNSGSIQLASEDFSGILEEMQVWHFDNRDYLAASKYYITGNLTYLWTVSGGVPKRDSASGLGDIRNDDGKLHVVQIAEDAIVEDGEYKGQTMKYYDMYYDGSFKEYGAIMILQSRFMDYEGADIIMEKLNTDYPGGIYNILYHNNGVIYINIQHNVENITYQHSAIVDITGNNAELRGVIEGCYQKALLKEIAVYPNRAVGTQVHADE